MDKQKRSGVIRCFLTAVLLGTMLSAAAEAAVLSTPEATGEADTIYVAGNPDWYPVEYYDRESRQYKGVLPELLELAGERSGLDFTYVQAGPEDQRQRLAENGQVELVSGCRTDEAWLQEADMHISRTIVSLPTEEGQVQVCLAFTKIADEGLIQRVEQAMAELTPQDTAGLAVRLLSERPPEAQPPWAGFAAAAALLLLIVSSVLVIKIRRDQKAGLRDERIDPLTGIWNKVYFADFYQNFISDRYRDLYCVVYIGFDIVRVNQYYGEGEAEEQLCFAAKELQLSTRDNETAARVSGGGFAVARPSNGEQEIQTWTGQLLDRLNRYMERYGNDYRPSFRAGIYMLRSADRDCESALFNARQGYQQALGRGLPWVIVQPEQLAQESERLQLKKQTLDALQNREFQMFLQFIVRGADGKICGAEAVSRWDHPQKGLLYPGSYIELMEGEGTIVELDFYIFEAVCRQLEQWQAAGRPLLLSCNFSRITIGREAFVQRIQEIAERYTFDRGRLVMEITEDAMESNQEAAFSNISRCRELGFQIALDDAGSGYTSFADLRDYPINVVKIDRSILNAAVTRRGAALLRGITALVHDLEMEVLCEGAETADQVELLRGIGCDYIQGYYYYRPLPLKEAERVLNQCEAQEKGGVACFSSVISPDAVR